MTQSWTEPQVSRDLPGELPKVTQLTGGNASPLTQASHLLIQWFCCFSLFPGGHREETGQLRIPWIEPGKHLRAFRGGTVPSYWVQRCASKLHSNRFQHHSWGVCIENQHILRKRSSSVQSQMPNSLSQKQWFVHVFNCFLPENLGYSSLWGPRLGKEPRNGWDQVSKGVAPSTRGYCFQLRCKTGPVLGGLPRFPLAGPQGRCVRFLRHPFSFWPLHTGIIVPSTPHRCPFLSPETTVPPWKQMSFKKTKIPCN